MEERVGDPAGTRSVQICPQAAPGPLGRDSRDCPATGSQRLEPDLPGGDMNEEPGLEGGLGKTRPKDWKGPG